MPNQVIIVHGWSDDSESFEPLADFLAANDIAAVPLFLGDYVSRDDDVRVEDVAKRMDAVITSWIENGTITPPFDMIVHSTGGLVARQWLVDFYPQGQAPLQRLVMLAPANHGSPLAKMGKSLIGRVVKGWDNWFSSGKEMLDALELASPFQWALVQRDMLSQTENQSSPYGADRVWPFVIIGTHPYGSGPASIVDENGGDGTVRVPAANMNTRGITIDFTKNPDDPECKLWKDRTHGLRIPFAVLPDRNHGTVVDPDPDESEAADLADQQELGRKIVEALQCPDAIHYSEIATRWDEYSQETCDRFGDDGQREAFFDDEDKPVEYFHQYMQAVIYVTDDHGNDVTDYFIEFSNDDGDPDRDAGEFFHKEILENVKVNSLNAAMRCLFIDRTDLEERYYPLIEKGPHELAMQITAAPPGNNITYFANAANRSGGRLIVHREVETVEARRWLKRNQTHYVHIIIPRVPKDRVFRLRRRDEPFTPL